MNSRALLRNLARRTPLRNWCFYRYQFMFTPGQLGFLCSELSGTTAEGSVVEIGCAFGHTTVFLNRHMDAEGIERPYHCLDTFGGFLEEDVRLERAQGREVNTRSFKTNDLRWFQTTMALNSIERVTAWQADASTFDYSKFAPIAMALVDVDLYRPVISALDRLWPHLAPGGVVIVDDCKTGSWEGALAAYREFCSKTGMPEQVECEKLGVLRRP